MNFDALATWWLPLAVLGHLCNGVAFIIDKVLLHQTFQRPGTYVILIGGISGLGVLFLPFVHVNASLSTYALMFGFGALFVLALWAFFTALQRSEASRVVPIVGALIPIFTFLGSTILLHEDWRFHEVIGFCLLVLATVLLTSDGRGKRGPDRRTLWFACLAAVVFAAASLCGKAAYLRLDALSVFVLSRFGGVAAALFVIAVDRKAWQEVKKVFIHKRLPDSRAKKIPVQLVLFGQALGSFGFLCVNAALAFGSAAIVNALQATQYAAIVLVAWIGGSRLRKMLQEEWSPRTAVLKGIALLLVAGGLWFVAY